MKLEELPAGIQVHKVEIKIQSCGTVALLCPSLGLFRYFLVLDINVQAVDFKRLALVKTDPF